MTANPRRPQRTRADGIPATPHPPQAPGTTDPALAGQTTVPVPVPVDRLTILDEYAGPDGLLPVVALVSHDAVFAGQHIRVPITDRVAGLIERGFLEVEFPEQELDIWQ